MKKSLLLLIVLAVSSIAHSQTRSALIHFKGGEVKEFYCDNIDSITFTPSVTFSKEFVATNYWCKYYGKGYYYVTLSDAPMDSLGKPTQPGQTIVRFYPIGKKSIDSKNAILPSGRYDSSVGLKIGGLFDGVNAMDLLYCTGIDGDGPKGYEWHMTSAVANVTYNSDNTYNIDFRCLIDNDEARDKGFEHTHVVYSGPLTFGNEDPEYYEMLSSDVVMVPTAMGGRYENSPGAFGFYSLSFFNTPVDNEGFVVGAGELLSLNLFTADGSPMDISKLEGTYTATSYMSGPYTPGTFADGVMYSGMPTGTCYQTFDEQGNSTKVYGFVKSGTITVTRNGSQFRFVCDLTTENNHKITMDYTGDESTIIDQSVSQSYAPAVKAPLSKMLQGVDHPNVKSFQHFPLILTKVNNVK